MVKSGIEPEFFTSGQLFLTAKLSRPHTLISLFNSYYLTHIGNKTQEQCRNLAQ